MATEAEIQKAMDLFHTNNPNRIFEQIRKVDVGMVAVLKYLNQNKNGIKSKDISDYMKVSSARMAILLKKMESKNLIEKSTSKEDCRVTIVKLTEYGEEIVKQVRIHMEGIAEKIVDELGIEELERIFEGLNKIKKLMKDNTIDILKD